MTASFLLLLLLLVVSSSACPSENYDHATWPSTPTGNTATGFCLRGYDSVSSPSRLCMGSGSWSSSISNRCLTLKCPANTAEAIDWPATAAGRSSVRPCPLGQWYQVQRYCGYDGVWQNPVFYCV